MPLCAPLPARRITCRPHPPLSALPLPRVTLSHFPTPTPLCARIVRFEGHPFMQDVSLAAAFLAGLISFLSPCVLPLVPGYISMLSGIGLEQLREGKLPRTSLLASALAFVSGLSLVFIALGASASFLGRLLK